MSILQQDQSYTFSKYFEMGISAEDLIEEFGYKFSRKRLDLLQYEGNLDRLLQLKEDINEVLPYFDLSNETSPREVLISPIILDLVHYTKSKVRIEYQIKINIQLQGYLDYLIKKNNIFLVIEAKKADLDYGFTQLSAELIALDQWEKIKDQQILLAAVTTGSIWQFGRLNRCEKHIEQDLKVYVVPDELEPLMNANFSSRVAIGQTQSGRYLKIIYVPEPESDSAFIITAYQLTGKPLNAYRKRKRRK